MMGPWDVNGHFIDLQIDVERTIQLNYLIYTTEFIFFFQKTG